MPSLLEKSIDWRVNRLAIHINHANGKPQGNMLILFYVNLNLNVIRPVLVILLIVIYIVYV